MDKKIFMKNLKRESYNNIKLFFENMSRLYDVFNDNNIPYNEYEIWQYIKEMELTEISDMFISILSKLERLNLKENYFNPVIFKFLICEYIQDIRTINELQ